jgi:hypothetical protein
VDRLERVLWRGRILAPYRRHQFAAFGKDSILHRPDWIAHPEKIDGRCCMIGANSVVRGEIPDYSIAVGAPARVVGSTRDQFT